MIRILRIKMSPTTTTTTTATVASTGRRRNKEWMCCFGLHVRTATIIIGVWHLCLNLLALCMLTIIIRNPAMVNELEDGVHGDFGVDVGSDQDMAPALPTPLSKIEPPHAAYRDHDINYQNVDMSGFVCLCMIAISSMMIYGSVKGKPSYLLPFFCLQLFDFAITTLTAANFLCYLRSVHRLIENHKLPFRDELLELNPQTLSILVLFVFICVVLLKAYAIGIVWRCYKFLTLQRQNIASMLPYIIPEVTTTGGSMMDRRLDRDYCSLLPDYDEAIAQSLKQAPPPSYQVAVSINGHVNLSEPPLQPLGAEATSRPATLTSEEASTSTDSLASPPPPYDESSHTPSSVVVTAAAAAQPAEPEPSQRSADGPTPRSS